MKTIIALFFLFSISITYSGETFRSEKGQFQITFPTDYDEQIDETPEMTSIAVTCIHKGMMFFVTAFIYNEKIPKDQYANKIAEGILITADSFNSKFKKRKINVWHVDDEHKGLTNPIKGKVYSPDGEKTKLFGRMNICMANNIEFRVSAFAEKRKLFNQDIFQMFINSFQIL